METELKEAEATRTFENYDRVYEAAWHWPYRHLRSRLREWYKLRRHVAGRVGLRKGARVLEVACGQGYHVDSLRRMGFDVTGVDLSAGGVDFARRTFPASRFLHLDASTRMPFPDGSFDLVWSHGAGFFHYNIKTPEVEAIIREHVRLVAPGGHYLIMISSDLSGAKPDTAMRKEWQHTRQDLAEVLRRHGRQIETDWFPIRRWLVGPATCNGYVVGTLRIPVAGRRS